MALSKHAGPHRWKLRWQSIVYGVIGTVFGLFSVGLLWAVGERDDYDYVPHACEGLECLHGTRTAPDGRVHCAKYPPKDLKLAEVSAGYVTFCQVAVGCCGLGGLGSAALTAGYGAQWLFTPARRRRRAGWSLRLRLLAPFGAVLWPMLALFFLWPYGLVPT